MKRSGKKILLVVHNFPPDGYGGVEVYTNGIARSLARKGLRVTVLYSGRGGAKDRDPIENKGETDGVEVFRLSTSLPPFVKPYRIVLYRSKRYYLEVRNSAIESLFGRFVRDRDFDLVHFQHLHYSFPFSLPSVARSCGKTVCMTLHDAWLICARTHLYVDPWHAACDGPTSVDKCTDCLFLKAWPVGKSKVRGLITRRRQCAREVLGSIDLLAAPSRFLAEVFGRHGFEGRGIVVAPLGIQPVSLIPVPKARAAVTFGYFGALSPLKNTALLVDAFRSVRGKARLILWGGGDSRYIRRILRSVRGDVRIEYRGGYAPEDLPAILGEIDVTVLPSVIESYSLVIRESLGGGIPVIASAVGGIPEIVRNGVNGILFDPDDPASLAAILQGVVDDPSMIERLRQGIVPPKTIDEDAEEWVARYDMLMGDGSGSDSPMH